MDNLINDSNEKVEVYVLYNEWEQDGCFPGGIIWNSFEKFCKNELLDKDYMADLISRMLPLRREALYNAYYPLRKTASGGKDSLTGWKITMIKKSMWPKQATAPSLRCMSPNSSLWRWRTAYDYDALSHACLDKMMYGYLLYFERKNRGLARGSRQSLVMMNNTCIIRRRFERFCRSRNNEDYTESVF